METTTTYGPLPAPPEAPPLADRASFATGALRLATGAASIYAFGLACGAAHLSLGQLGRAAELVSTPVLFAVFFAPSLWVILTLFDQPIDAGDVADAASRGVSAMGSLLLGLVPAAFFFELTAGGEDGVVVATVLEIAAFCFAGLVGLARFRHRLVAAPGATEWLGLAFLAFAALAVVFGLSFAPSTIVAMHGGALR